MNRQARKKMAGVRATSCDIEQVIQAALLGHAVGDALGVPAEFNSRAHLKRHPVIDMTGYGTHNQPAGTWSDDTSLTLCAAESLCEGYDLRDMGQRFVRWMFKAHWTPHGEVFDIGQTTREAIFRLDKGIDPKQAGPTTDHSNGNGSLMRILPIAIYFAYSGVEARREAAMDCSRLTHGHIRSQLACAFYAELVARLIGKQEYVAALCETQFMFDDLIGRVCPQERSVFERVLDPAISKTKARHISGSGYVVHCLEASLWSCANSRSYEEAVLTAVNLGLDTDTTAAVTGGLAGLRFGMDAIPSRWIEQLARINDIKALYGRFAGACCERWEMDDAMKEGAS